MPLPPFPSSRSIRRVLQILVFWPSLVLALTAPWWLVASGVFEAMDELLWMLLNGR